MDRESNRKKWRVAFFAFLVLVLVLSVLAYNRIIPVNVRWIPYYDKIGHFILLGLASYLGYRATGRRHLVYFGVHVPSAPMLVMLLSLADEGLQAVTPYRNFSVLDLAANLGGVLFFYWIDRIWLDESR
ncbi:MAG: VanZ family protein [Chloroflexota bacterium]|nr:VanZ family protein [Chloroflexota bacterium]